ncbi:MAG: DNA/RNA non-specific endonuclease [Candidatus Cryptobacteroides sp.]
MPGKSSNRGWIILAVILVLCLGLVVAGCAVMRLNRGQAGVDEAVAGDGVPEDNGWMSDTTGWELPAWTSGGTSVPVTHSGYTASYNTERLIPDWVAYTLTAEEVAGTVGRGSGFRPDPSLDCPQAVDADYRNSGWDRGHMAPAADMRWSTSAMSESFYLVNVCPQHPGLNRGDWKELEDLCRNLAVKYGELRIVCGPLVRDNALGRIGSGVCVPDAFFKALLARTDSLTLSSIAFVFENAPGNRPVASYAVSVDSVETLSGLDLFARLPDGPESLIESSFDLSLWGL